MSLPQTVEVNYHRVEGEKWNVEVEAVGDLTPGGAYAHYEISGFLAEKNNFNVGSDGLANYQSVASLIFQAGNPADGVVGITMESLLAVCKHRLEMLQAGPFPCYQNAEALKGVTRALDALKNRTIQQLAIAEARAERGEQ